MHTLCMLKVTEKIFYRYQGEDLHLAATYRKIRKGRGRAKILASVMVEIGKNDKGIPVPAKIVFVRDRRTKKSGWPCCPPTPPWATSRSSSTRSSSTRRPSG